MFLTPPCFVHAPWNDQDSVSHITFLTLMWDVACSSVPFAWKMQMIQWSPIASGTTVSKESNISWRRLQRDPCHHIGFYEPPWKCSFTCWYDRNENVSIVPIMPMTVKMILQWSQLKSTHVSQVLGWSQNAQPTNRRVQQKAVEKQESAPEFCSSVSAWVRLCHVEG